MTLSALEDLEDGRRFTSSPCKSAVIPVPHDKRICNAEVARAMSVTFTSSGDDHDDEAKRRRLEGLWRTVLDDKRPEGKATPRRVSALREWLESEERL
jgi:hypothetical protein